MAHAALVSLAQTIDKILNHPQYSNLVHEKQRFISIQEYTIFLQAFLEDVPKKPIKFEERIRDLAYRAEDVIEYSMLKQFRLSNSRTVAEVAGVSQHKGGIFMCLKRKRRGFYRKGDDLQKVGEEIDLIAREVMEIKNSFTLKDVQLSDFSASASASSSSRPVLTRKETMVGLDDDLLAIKTRLCGESSNLQIIPIFGMGGIGKTTLARNAYDDQLTVEHFHIRAWVTVSQDYSAREILLGLLISMKVVLDAELKKEELDRDNESKMAENVYKNLKGKRYLIVLDDIWSTKAWDDVRMIFPDDSNGSRIMLTTRLKDVASYPDSYSRLHEMHFMDADQSWDLLRQKVFARESCPLELESIGKQIASSCRGLPLAIVVVAGILSTVRRTRASWENIVRNVNQAVAENNEQFAKVVLSLSYDHLPQHLRQCFLYIGGLPEDYEVHVSKLSKLWGAEGFLKPSLSKSPEEEAEDYLEDLVKRSLVMVIKRKTNGKIKSCSVHDLVRDLCIKKAHEEKFLLNAMDSYLRKVFMKSVKNQRRISIALSDLDFIRKIHGSTTRTIICFQRSGSSLGFLGNFKLLRVLDVVNIGDVNWVVWLPEGVFELFHLRYLAFTYRGDFHLPSSIVKLQNLQTLIMHPRMVLRRYLSFMVCLPPEIWKMSQLRHLVSVSFGPLPGLGSAAFPLEQLQTLSEVQDFECTERIMKMIPNLKKLGICYNTGQDKHVQDYQLENLVHLHQLEKLKIKVYENFSFRPKLNPVFPLMLKKLTLSGWRLPWNEMKVVGLLPNLEVLKLMDFSCEGDTWETSEGEFPQLKYLMIEESFLRYWITESSHFPYLKCLVLHLCRYLSEIPEGIGEIPTLEQIEVDKQNSSLVYSAKKIQEEQIDWGNECFIVRILDCEN